MRNLALLATSLLIFTAFAGCTDDSSNGTSGSGPNSTCWVLLQTTSESSSNPGSYLYANFTYDSDCRVTVSETLGTMYQNTTYDTDGNIATVETATWVQSGGGDGWHYSNLTNLWGEP